MEKEMSLLGQTVKVRDKIKYAEKVEAGNEYAARAVMFDEENGIAYFSFLEDAIAVFMRIKAYTDMDMAPYEGYDGLCALMDAVSENPITEFENFTHIDYIYAQNLWVNIAENAVKVFEKTHSMEYRAMKSFAFLFDGKDITETLAEARQVNEEMIDHLGALSKQKPIDITQYAKKKKV